MRRSTKMLFSLSAATLLIAACDTVMRPSFMPAGYTYHQEAYKSPPNGTPWDIGYEYTHAKNKEVLDQWHFVAADLISQLEETNLLGQAPVHLASPDIDNAFSLSLDHALRSEMRARNYTIEAFPTVESLKLVVSAYDPEYETNLLSYDYNDIEEGNPEPPELINKDIGILIKAPTPEQDITLVNRIYNLPLYGYQERKRYFPLTQGTAEVWR